MSKPIAPIEDRRLLAIGLVLGSLLCFTVIDVSAKWLVIGGVPALEVVFVRYSVQLVLVLFILAPVEGGQIFRSRNLKLELLRATVLLCSTIANFIALIFLPLTITGTIMFLIPLLVCALSVPLLGERMGWRRWLAVLIGFAGILVIIRPGSDAFHWAVLVSLAGVTAAAFYNITTRKLAGVDSAPTQQVFGSAVPTLVIAPFAFAGWIWPDSGSHWLAFFAMGAAATLGHLIFTIAHRFAPASTLAPFTYFHIIYMTAASWAVFGQVPDLWFYLGVPIVMGSGLWIWWRERQLARAGSRRDEAVLQDLEQSEAR